MEKMKNRDRSQFLIDKSSRADGNTVYSAKKFTAENAKTAEK
jgi:hypothetical protein